jgi:hypothetical protein
MQANDDLDFESSDALDAMFGQQQEHADIEAISRLRRLPPGPWRSLGRYLDYTNWPERDRFLELDRAIARMRLESDCTSSRAA